MPLGRSPERKSRDGNLKGASEWTMVGKGSEDNNLEGVWREREVEICGICQTRVGPKQMGLECDACRAWFHATCTEMRKEDYDKVTKINDNARIKWFCLKCEKKNEGLQKENVMLRKENISLKEEVLELKKLMKQMMEQMNKMERTIEKRIEEDISKKWLHFQSGFERKIEEMQYGINKVREEFEDMKNGNTVHIGIGPEGEEQDREERKKEIEQIKKDLVTEGVKEIRKERDVEERKVYELQTKIDEIERERKRKNVMIFNLRESKHEEAKERYCEDERNCKDIFSNTLGIQQVNIMNVIRLGKKMPNKVRPLLVKLGSEEERINILRNTSKLRQSQQFVRVYVTRDMTEKEREKDRSLRQELKEKREKEEDWYIIRRGRVVKAEGRKIENQEERQRTEQAVRPKENRRYR